MTLETVVMLLVAIAIVGAVVWVLVSFVPMPEGVRRIIIGIAIIALLLYALRQFGVM